jgi:hypothetical protein
MGPSFWAISNKFLELLTLQAADFEKDYGLKSKKNSFQIDGLDQSGLQ